MVAKGFRFTFLVKFVTDLFFNWTKAKIMDLNENYLSENTAKKDELIYDLGQQAETFYIVRYGELVLETIIEQETNMKFPIDTKSWEVKRTTKTL